MSCGVLRLANSCLTTYSAVTKLHGRTRISSGNLIILLNIQSLIVYPDNTAYTSKMDTALLENISNHARRKSRLMF